MTDERLRRWISSLLASPGLTAIRDPEEAWRVHVEQSLSALPVVSGLEGPIVDVGSGGGAPGIALASGLPDRDVTLLEASARKAAFLEEVSADFQNVRVVRGRAEEQPLEEFGVAVAKALAPPPVALEWCLPLVRVGGAALLFVGPSADAAQVAAVAERLGGGLPEPHSGFLVVPKVAPTPPGFPRRPGV
ncbi:MAG: class I SAM-dependent methyltransferase, partial [Actinobacteria bacterium]|nr:class I SAM-dependent methyltransferase [Actinomycetota bacterium]